MFVSRESLGRRVLTVYHTSDDLYSLDKAAYDASWSDDPSVYLMVSNYAAFPTAGLVIQSPTYLDSLS